MGSFLNRSVLKRLERIEQILLTGDVDRVYDVVYFNLDHGGIFGHAHFRYRLGDRKVDYVACTDEEEMELMRYKYEEYDHKAFGQGEVLSFPDFLEHFFYLSPNVPEERKKAAVQKLREGANSSPNPNTNSPANQLSDNLKK